MTPCLKLYLAELLCLLCSGHGLVLRGKYSDDTGGGWTVYPEKLSPDRRDLPRVEGSHGNKRSAWEGNEVRYKIPLCGMDKEIHLTPSNNIAPGAILERRNGEVGDTSNPLKGVQLEPLKEDQSLYRGYVVGEDDSSAAMSTKEGLAGYVRLGDSVYFVEPCSKPEGAHLIYRRTAIGCACGTRGRWRPRRKTRGSNSSRAATDDTPLHLETLLVLDKSLVDHHPDVENYALTVFNMAANLFHDSSFGALMNLDLVRIIRMDQEDDELGLRSKRNASGSLEAFAAWQSRINPIADWHPNHHDIAALITRSDVSTEGGCEGLIGIAKKGGACDKRNQAVIVKDTGLRVGYVLAHQLAHTLGINHVEGPLVSDHSQVMSPEIDMGSQGWSLANRDELHHFIRDGFGECLFDEPAEHNFPMIDVLPGVMYGPDYQCQQLLNERATECEIGSTCSSLNCKIDGYGCVKTGVPPAPGTKCGENKWCYMGECVELGERPEAVDGGWSEWTAWSPCSRSCGSGVSVAKRECNSPRPSFGGRFCQGSNKKHKICSSEPCDENALSFRDVQCSSFNNWRFPEDGELHKWKEYYMMGENPCNLYCINEKNVVASMNRFVEDGTPCYRGIRDVCIGGVCKGIPCDLLIESSAVEDVCGICHGDGTECRIVEGVKEYRSTGLKEVITAPDGARNIKIDEMEPSKSQLIVKKVYGNETYIKGIKPGTYDLAGSSAWLGIIRPRQESLVIPGPISESLLIMVNVVEPVSVKYSMGVKSGFRQGEYSWDYVDWSKCSAQCGPGTQIAQAKCIEKIGGLVEDKYCDHLIRPPAKIRSCNLRKCTPRWLLGDWQECGPCPSPAAKHFRMVKCVRLIGEGEGETEIIDDSFCGLPKPLTIEWCDCSSEAPPKESKSRNKRSTDYMWPQMDVFHQILSPPIEKTHPTEIHKESKPEGKVTLMQVENECEESMRKQFKENQPKKKIDFDMFGKGRHPIILNPHMDVFKASFTNSSNRNENVKRGLRCGREYRSFYPEMDRSLSDLHRKLIFGSSALFQPVNDLSDTGKLSAPLYQSYNASRMQDNEDLKSLKRLYDALLKKHMERKEVEPILHNLKNIASQKAAYLQTNALLVGNPNRFKNVNQLLKKIKDYKDKAEMRNSFPPKYIQTGSSPLNPQLINNLMKEDKVVDFPNIFKEHACIDEQSPSRDFITKTGKHDFSKDDAPIYKFNSCETELSVLPKLDVSAGPKQINDYKMFASLIDKILFHMNASDSHTSALFNDASGNPATSGDIAAVLERDVEDDSKSNFETMLSNFDDHYNISKRGCNEKHHKVPHDSISREELLCLKKIAQELQTKITNLLDSLEQKEGCHHGSDEDEYDDEDDEDDEEIEDDDLCENAPSANEVQQSLKLTLGKKRPSVELKESLQKGRSHKSILPKHISVNTKPLDHHNERQYNHSHSGKRNTCISNKIKPETSAETVKGLASNGTEKHKRENKINSCTCANKSFDLDFVKFPNREDKVIILSKPCEKSLKNNFGTLEEFYSSDHHHQGGSSKLNLTLSLPKNQTSS